MVKLSRNPEWQRLQLIQIVKGWRELNPKSPFKKLEDDELLYRVGTLRDWTKAGLPYSPKGRH